MGRGGEGWEGERVQDGEGVLTIHFPIISVDPNIGGFEPYRCVYDVYRKDFPIVYRWRSVSGRFSHSLSMEKCIGRIFHIKPVSKELRLHFLNM